MSGDGFLCPARPMPGRGDLATTRADAACIARLNEVSRATDGLLRRGLIQGEEASRVRRWMAATIEHLRLGLHRG